VTKQELMKKLDAVVAKAENDRMYGAIELEMRDGRCVILRTVNTEKFESTRELNRAKQQSFDR
jgi:hypothetical protein